MEIIKEEYEEKYDVFCENAQVYDTKKGNPFKITVSFIHNKDLLRSLLKYYTTMVDPVDMNELIENIQDSYTFTVYSCIRYHRLIYQISKLLHVPSDKIQLYQMINGHEYQIIRYFLKFLMK